MKCRALLICTSGGDAPKGELPRGSRCPHEATEVILGRTHGARVPELCWVHSRALSNPERQRRLEFAPLSASDAVELGLSEILAPLRDAAMHRVMTLELPAAEQTAPANHRRGKP